MLTTEAAGGVVLNAKGQVALVTNGPHFWGFPKGHVDPGEEILDAARREVYEETGLKDLELIRALPVYERYRGTPEGGDDTRELKKIHMFLFRTKESEMAPLDPANPEARWIAPESVEKILTHPKDREFFRAAEIAIHSR